IPTSFHKNYNTVKGRTERRTKCQIYKSSTLKEMK
ncbi:hypothetical protein ACVZEI_15095, partial [Listeria monocytogenes]